MGCGLCIGDLILFVFGMIVFITAKIKLSPNWAIEGAMARLVGVLLMLSLLAGPAAAFIYSFAIGADEGMKLAEKTRQPLDQGDMRALNERILEKIEGPSEVITVAGSAVPLMAAILLSIACAKRSEKATRSKDRDDDPDRRPRRSRREGATEENEDRPRDRRRGDDDDPPRRRRPGDEGEDDHDEGRIRSRT
jgi:hypothetical protein